MVDQVGGTRKKKGGGCAECALGVNSTVQGETRSFFWKRFICRPNTFFLDTFVFLETFWCEFINDEISSPRVT